MKVTRNPCMICSTPFPMQPVGAIEANISCCYGYVCWHVRTSLNSEERMIRIGYFNVSIAQHHIIIRVLATTIAKVFYRNPDGPARGDRWLCWRCAHAAPGGFKKNWVFPRLAAHLKPGSEIYVAEEQGACALTPCFLPATVISTHPTYAVIQSSNGESSGEKTEIIARESERIWHGSLSRLVWEEAADGNSTSADCLFAPKSRKYCPHSFFRIAAQHGVAVPRHIADTAPINSFHQLKKTGKKSSHCVFPAVESQSKISLQNNTPPGMKEKGGPSNTADAKPHQDVEFSSLSDLWLQATRRFGQRINDKVLMCMPEYLSLRRDLYVHSFALWHVVMTWGGEEVVNEHKMWGAVAHVFNAPATMTNRSVKMRQLWSQFHMKRLTAQDAQDFSKHLKTPPIDGDLLFDRKHPILDYWPTCVRQKLPEAGAVGRASNRGTSLAKNVRSAGGTNQAGVRKPGCTSATGRGSQKRRRSASESEGGFSEIETPSEAPASEAPASDNDAELSPAFERKRQKKSQSGHTEISEDELDGQNKKKAQRKSRESTANDAVGKATAAAAAPPPCPSPKSESDNNDENLGAGFVAEGASQLRRMPLSALPPKRPPGLHLPEGAIWCEYARRLRLGDYMIRLDTSCIQTSMVPRIRACELGRIALRGESPKIQFVSTEKDFLGGWWDATLRGARSGSVLEGGIRYLVEEHYPGDPDDPHPRTWVPLVFHGPQAYPFQTPQVMLRDPPDWKPAEKKEQAPKLAVGDLIEAMDVPDEGEDTVLWRGCVHELQSDDSAVVRLLVAPYGNAGAVVDPSTVSQNFQTHCRLRMRHAPLDDLMNMIREPSEDPEKREIRAMATTDQMELQVLQFTRLVVGKYAGGKGVASIEAHASFKTGMQQQAEEAASLEKSRSRKRVEGGSKQRKSISHAIAAAYKTRQATPQVSGKLEAATSAATVLEQDGEGTSRATSAHTAAPHLNAASKLQSSASGKQVSQEQQFSNWGQPPAKFRNMRKEPSFVVDSKKLQSKCAAANLSFTARRLVGSSEDLSEIRQNAGAMLDQCQAGRSWNTSSQLDSLNPMGNAQMDALGRQCQGSSLARVALSHVNVGMSKSDTAHMPVDRVTFSGPMMRSNADTRSSQGYSSSNGLSSGLSSQHLSKQDHGGGAYGQDSMAAGAQGRIQDWSQAWNLAHDGQRIHVLPHSNAMSRNMSISLDNSIAMQQLSSIGHSNGSDDRSRARNWYEALNDPSSNSNFDFLSQNRDWRV